MKNERVSHFRERFNQLIRESGKFAYVIAKELGVSKQTISMWQAGTRSPRQPMIISIANYFDVDIPWLMGYDVPKRLPSNAIPVEQMHRIPIVGTIKAGNGGLAYEDLEGYEYIDVKDPDNHFFLRVTGDSMMPDIRPNELALIRKQPTVESGELAAVVINGDEGTIKKVIKTGSAIVLQAFNPEYNPRIFSGEELNDIHIAGKVVKTVRRW